jgi:hypothetical protein
MSTSGYIVVAAVRCLPSLLAFVGAPVERAEAEEAVDNKGVGSS